jgi:hypothetical protein
MKNEGPDLENFKRKSKTTYIICPDMACKGFFEDLCEDSRYTGLPGCPHKDRAYKIIFCRYGHLNKLSIDDGGAFTRMHCRKEGCIDSKINCTNSEETYRIPLENIDEFLKKEFVKNE